MASIDQLIPQVESTFRNNDPSSFYSKNPGKPWKREYDLTCGLITPNSQSEPLRILRTHANPPPNLNELNEFRKEGDKVTCLKKYSNPGYFFAQWFEDEQKKQQKLLEDKARKKSRKKRTEKEKRKRKKKEEERKASRCNR